MYAIVFILVILGVYLSMKQKGKLIEIDSAEISISNLGSRYILRWNQIASIKVLINRDMVGDEKPLTAIFQSETGEIVNYITLEKVRDNKQFLDILAVISSNVEEMPEKDFDRSTAAVKDFRREAISKPHLSA